MEGNGIKVANNDDLHRWNAYLLSIENNVPLNHFEWSKIVSTSYRNQTPLYLYKESDKGEIEGVFSGFVIKSPLGKKRLHSTRFGFVANDDKVADEFIIFLKGYCKQNKIISAVITTGFNRYNFNCREIIKHTLVMELQGDSEFLWEALRAKTRNAIRKGNRSGLRIEESSRYLNKFHEIYKNRMLKINANVLSKKYMHALFDNFDSNVKLFTVWKESVMLGGLILIFTKDAAQYIYAGTIKEAEKYNVMHYLLWEVIKILCQNNISFFDMSESTKNNGVYKFKSLFGGQEKNIYYYDILKVKEKKIVSNVSKNKYEDKMPSMLKKIFIQYMTRYSRII